MPLNLPQLRAFLAVVDAGGFSAAAVELGMTQSAVSHAVASLERELAAPSSYAPRPYAPPCSDSRSCRMPASRSRRPVPWNTSRPRRRSP